LFTVAGGALGFVALIALSMLGIGALLKASANALTILKLLGGAYLVWLGVQLWRAPAIRLKPDAASAGAAGAGMFRQGLLTAVSNPKALLFYGAFLPQFIDPGRELWIQFVVMATIFVAIEIVVEYLLALLAHRIRPVLERAGKNFNRTCGGMFVAMGVALPMTR
jgi:threonine/homoserine/homoserine lactone efflux protein